MIRRLRIKFISVTMGVLICLFAVMFLTLNMYMQESSLRQTEQLLQTVAREDGFLFQPINVYLRRENSSDAPSVHAPEMMRAGRFFYVKTNHEGELIETNFEMMFDFSREEVVEYAEKVLQRNREKGTVENLQFLVAEKSYGKIVVFAERSMETRLLTRLIYISVGVAIATFAVLFAFTFILSKWAVNPVQEAFEKQRKFISDAGHELKTPLTTIIANTDVLEGEIGENRRIGQIKNQLNRMSNLIHDLLTLARADEHSADIIRNEFNLSKTTRKTVLEFESLAFEEHKRLNYQVDEDIVYSGEREKIERLIAILIDNAIRHSDEDGGIKVTLQRSSGKITLSVYNTGAGIPEEERSKIFDRFYRSDHSRSRDTGGYGLGLAIAKMIADAHNAKIRISGEEGKWVEFSVVFVQ